MALHYNFENMIDQFCEAMKEKLLLKFKSGYHGYDMPHMQGPIEQKLKRNLKEKDWIDVGALAAMRWGFNKDKSDDPT